jgi:glyoxylase-like metal-dependent hydrolase (beta-lactamase superfamily II)/ferredoxin
VAQLEKRLPQNVPGEFYVDSSCIDCDTCRFVAPSVFARSDDSGQSFVQRQPGNGDDEQNLRALMALVACPTASIATVSPSDARTAASRFPEPVADDVYYCGYSSAASFGASSYLVRRASGNAGNALIDSPRAAGPLLRRIDELGGVSRMLLSHRDDIADHAKFRRRYGCERVIHKDEVSSSTADIEVQLEISEPLQLDDDFLVIPVPGHTKGSVAYLYREKYLFSGDHLWWSPNVNGLHASPRVCWYDWDLQIASMERLLEFECEWVLPGHGRRYQAASAAAMRGEIERVVARMRGSE